MDKANATEFYGLISGSVASVFADAVNKKMNNSMIVSVWNDIQEFQKDVGSNAQEKIKGLKAILITDKAFDEKADVKTKEFAFHFMQSMFKQKDLYGLHIILYTKDANLLDALETRYMDDPDSKYEGTRILLATGDYKVSSIQSVFNTPFTLLSYDDKKKREMEKIIEEAHENENRRISNRGLMMLLGKQQALQEQLDYTQRELLVVNRKIIEYATSINDDNLDIIVDDIQIDSTKDIRKQFETLR